MCNGFLSKVHISDGSLTWVKCALKGAGTQGNEWGFIGAVTRIADKSAQQACTISVHFALVSKQIHVLKAYAEILGRVPGTLS